MSISPDGKTVSFKTDTDDLFMAEKSGAKPNTVRIIDSYEHEQLKKKLPHKIIIQHEQEIILRTLSHVYVSDMILGKYLAIFSWLPKFHRYSVSEDPVQKAHIMNPRGPGEPPIDEDFTAVTISRNLLHSLELIAHGRSINMVIRELYETSCYT